MAGRRRVNSYLALAEQTPEEDLVKGGEIDFLLVAD